MRQNRLFLLILCFVAYGLAIAAGIAVLDGTSGHIIKRLLIADIAATLVIFAVGQMVRNSSLYDPYWSIAPPLLILGYALAGDGVIGVPRGAVVFALTSLWAWRLTWNCLRRWPSLLHEDFRYQALRKASGRFYPLVDLFGIHLVPTLFVFLGCLPFYPIFVLGWTYWNWIDWIALIVTAGGIITEWRADRTLWRFKKTAKDGQILSTGLWARVRHPNYCGEILFWGGLWIFALGVGWQFWWTGAGLLSMILLFRFISIPLMEKRNEERRPGYAETVKDRPLLIPWQYPKTSKPENSKARPSLKKKFKT